jgi:hypothetical protein
MFKKKTKKEIVYSSTNLSDLLSSPVFYSVIALAFILGLSSIFGFFNNPRKLKTVVDVISQKILVNPNSNTVSFDSNDDYLLRKYSLKVLDLDLTESAFSASSGYNPYDITSNLITLDDTLGSASTAKQALQRVSFDYDITSRQFWGDLDATRIESAIEESERRDRDTLMIGVPLSSEYSLEEGDNKYSMGFSLRL